MDITAYTTTSVFEALQDEWNELLQESTDDLIFLTREWQSAWWAAYHPGELWVLTVRDGTGRLAGIAPWFIETQPAQRRVVRSIGCVDVTDYLSIIVQREGSSEVYRALAAYLVEQQDQFDALDLCNIPETAHLLNGGFVEALRALDVNVEVQEQEVCPVVTLPEDFASYVQALDKKQRHELKRKMRKIDGFGDDIQWYVVTDDHDLNAEMQHFLALMRSASQDKREFLENAAHVAFFERIVPLIHQNGWLQLSFMTIQGDYAAAYLSFIYNNRILVYNSGLDASVGGTLSPGIVLLANLIRDAITDGYTHFDFLRGDEEYKYQMGGKDTRVMNLMAQFSTSA